VSKRPDLKPAGVTPAGAAWDDQRANTLVLEKDDNVISELDGIRLPLVRNTNGERFEHGPITTRDGVWSIPETN
jgi:hypothetical protein